MNLCNFFKQIDFNDFCYNISNNDFKCLTDEPKPVQKMKVILQKIRRNTIKLGFYHNARYNKYRAWLFYFFRLPSLIISGVNGFLAIGLKSFPVHQNSVSITNAVMSFICSIITSIEISLNLQKRMESELDSYKRFYKLNVELDKELIVYDYNKDSDFSKLQDFLEKKYNEYQSIVQGSNIVTSEIIISEDEFEWIYENNPNKNKELLYKIRNDTINIFPNFNKDKQCLSISYDSNNITTNEKSTQITKYEKQEILDSNLSQFPSSPKSNLKTITLNSDNNHNKNHNNENEENISKKHKRNSIMNLTLFNHNRNIIENNNEHDYSIVLSSNNSNNSSNICQTCDSCYTPCFCYDFCHTDIENK